MIQIGPKGRSWSEERGLRELMESEEQRKQHTAGETQSYTNRYREEERTIVTRPEERSSMKNDLNDGRAITTQLLKDLARKQIAPH